MAQINVNLNNSKMIYPSVIDSKKAIFITFIAFIFAGFQAAIYGMLTIPISKHFGITQEIIVFYDSFGLWGQILAMATGGYLISRIKAKNVLILAALLMIVGSVGAVLAPNIEIYTLMAFLSNMAVGSVLVSCYYMTMGTVSKEGEGEGKLAIMNIFFSAGFMISPLINGLLIKNLGWEKIFYVIIFLFVLFIIILLVLNVNELADEGHKLKQQDKARSKDKGKRFDFLTPQVVLIALAFFMFVYFEQIINYFNQPHMNLDLGIQIDVIGSIVTAYALSQMVGRAVFGKFLLPRVQTHRYLVTAAAITAVLFKINKYASMWRRSRDDPRLCSRNYG